MPNLVSVQFLKSYQPFLKGEIAGVTPDVAEKLEKSKHVKILKQAKKKAPARSEPKEEKEPETLVDEGDDKSEPEDDQPEAKPKSNRAKSTK